MKTELETRASIRELQSILLAAPGKFHLHIKCEHEFVDGLYVRKMMMPSESVIVGKTHKKDHILLINRGGGIMINEKGKFKVKAGDVISSKANTKRAFRADVSGMEIITIHPNPTNEQDVEKLEKELVESI